jgi:signal transduction histidine kinase
MSPTKTYWSQQVKAGQPLISVSDTGIGMPPQQAERAFNAFFSTKAQGTGMGLPISHSIIESHGGPLVGHLQLCAGRKV